MHHFFMNLHRAPSPALCTPQHTRHHSTDHPHLLPQRLYVREGFVQFDKTFLHMGCWACVEWIVSGNGKYGARESTQRLLFLTFAAVGLPFTLVASWAHRERLVANKSMLGNSVLTVLSFLVTIFLVAFRFPVSERTIVGVMYFQCVLVFAADLNARVLGSERWPIVMLAVDYLLVQRVSTRYSVWLVATTAVYLSVVAGEQTLRLGLFDLPGMLPQEGEYGRRAFYESRIACDTLPCAEDFPPRTFFVSLAVFLLDFMATRGFARDVLKEQASMAQTISTVQEIASLLAGYDVEKVAELLEAHGADLPEGMLLALSALEANLRVYKAYLPTTCLPFDGFAANEGELDEARERSASESSEDTATLSTGSLSVSQSRILTKTTARLDLLPVKATLLTLNIKDSLRLLDDTTHFCEMFTSLLLETLSSASVNRGMVDVFIGDRIHCSFNTSRPCASHATSALHTATLLLKGIGRCESFFNIGIATGKVLRGDMGCEMMRRFSMIGTLARDVNGMERAGRILGCDVLCNRLCFSDGELEHQLRLIPRKVEVDAGCDEEVVAELVVTLTASEDDTPTGEWMYTLGKKDWDAYNSSVRAYFKGEASAADVTEAGLLHTHCLSYQAPSTTYTTLRLPARSKGREN